MLQARLLVAVTLCTAALVAAQAPAPASELLGPIPTHAVYFGAEPGEGAGKAAIAPNVAVVGAPLLNATETALTAEECSALCRELEASACNWFTWCGTEGGCADGAGGTLPFRQCTMLGESPSLPPLARSGPTVHVTSGFPLRPWFDARGVALTQLPGQGMSGGDFPCAGSLAPGACQLAHVDEGIALCTILLPTCKSVVLFRNGTTVLKSVLPGEGGWFAPQVSTLYSFGSETPTTVFLTDAESRTVPPSPVDLAANGGRLSANGTGALGLVIAPNALLSGTVVDVVDGVPSAEACGSECQRRGWGPGELRWQQTADLTIGFPPLIIAKGPNVTFTAGSPLAFWPADMPGFTTVRGRGLLGYSRYNCSDTVRSWECTRDGTMESLMQACDGDSQCAVVALKQRLPLYPTPNVTAPYRGFLRNDASKEAQLLIPTTALYIKNDTGSSGLSAGAIAGIVVGCCAAVALAAVFVLLAMRRRRRQAQALLPLAAKPADARTHGDDSSMHDVATLTSSSKPTDSVRALPELVKHVAEQDAALLSQGPHPSEASSEHQLVNVESLPPRLREWVADPASVTLLCWPDGKLQEIGRGASAHVYKAMLNGEVVAAKEIDIGASLSMQEAFLTEASRLQELRHPNVVGLMGVTLAGPKAVVLLEYCEGRDLHSALGVVAAGSGERLFGWHKRGKRVAHEVAKAINYLHSKGVVHLDIKSPNVLLTAGGTAKLADVGFSKQKTHTYLSDVPLVGTFAWVAPEVLLGNQQCTLAVDVYSFGIVLWEIVTGERPQRGQLRWPRVPEECPQDVSDLLFECLHEDPAARPTAMQLVQRLGQHLEHRPTPAARAGSSAAAGHIEVLPPMLASPFAAAAESSPPFSAPRAPNS